MDDNEVEAIIGIGSYRKHHPRTINMHGHHYGVLSGVGVVAIFAIICGIIILAKAHKP